MNARFYVPGIARFASADTIVPDPMNPQSYNRYAYVQNSPLNFTDPTGHDGMWCNDPSEGGGGCNQPPPSPTTQTIEVGHVGAMPISVIILPPGSKPQAPAPVAGKALDIVGIGLDTVEAFSAGLLIPGLPDSLALLDIFTETLATIANGDTYIGRPHETAPLMVTIGQDVFWSAFEAGGVFVAKAGMFYGGAATAGLPGAMLGGAAGNYLDVGTSLLSAGYDMGRLTGAIPNVVSFAMYLDESVHTRIPLPGVPPGQPGLAMVIYQDTWFNYAPLNVK